MSSSFFIILDRAVVEILSLCLQSFAAKLLSVGRVMEPSDDNKYEIQKSQKVEC